MYLIHQKVICIWKCLVIYLNNNVFSDTDSHDSGCPGCVVLQLLRLSVLHHPALWPGDLDLDLYYFHSILGCWNRAYYRGSMKPEDILVTQTYFLYPFWLYLSIWFAPIGVRLQACTICKAVTVIIVSINPLHTVVRGRMFAPRGRLNQYWYFIFRKSQI